MGAGGVYYRDQRDALQVGLIRHRLCTISIACWPATEASLSQLFASFSIWMGLQKSADPGQPDL